MQAFSGNPQGALLWVRGDDPDDGAADFAGGQAGEPFVLLVWVGGYGIRR
ncbi:MAG: hypothetical protein ACRDOK_29085 [Streptosporangiaceae bacterium]